MKSLAFELMGSYVVIYGEVRFVFLGRGGHETSSSTGNSGTHVVGGDVGID